MNFLFYLKHFFFHTVWVFSFLFFQPLFASPEKPYNGAFQTGEQLHYTVHWTYFLAGYAYMRIVSKINYKGIECLNLQSGARSVGFLGGLFRVRDKITSYWDFNGSRTLYGEKNIKEGNYLRRSITYFYPESRSAKWEEKVFSGNTKRIGKKKKNAKWEHSKGVSKELPLQIHDMLSAIYFNRSSSKEGKVGDSFHIDVLDDGKRVKLKMEILREETLPIKINGKKEKMPSFVVRPHITTEGTFRFKGKVLIWISNNRHRWPLLIKAATKGLGHIYVKLYRTVNTTSL